MASKGRTSVNVAATALKLLEQDGWIAVDSLGEYLICVPIPLSIPEPYVWPIEQMPQEKPTLIRGKEVTARKPRKDSPSAVPRVTSKGRVLNYVTYVIGIDGLPFVKIGHTVKPPEERLRSLQTGQPLALHLLCFVRGDYESALHAHFDDYRVRGEWFDLSSLGDPVEVVQAAVDEIEAAA